MDGGVNIGIVGAGFSGSLLAVHLLRRLPRGSRVVLVERRGGFGKGLAYSTASANHLLNVRAEHMSAFEDEPDHFLRWLAERNGVAPDELTGGFVPRQLFGDYVQSLLGAQLWQAGCNHNLYITPDEAVDLMVEGDGVTLVMAGGRRVRLTALVLAVGNLPPLPPPMAEAAAASPRFIADPWQQDAVARIADAAAVVAIGSGLTMVDFVISRDELGHRGSVTALSRRGLLPRAHARVGAPVSWDPARFPPSITALLALVRQRVRHEVAAGLDWRQVIDGLRPHVESIWAGLGHDHRRRFLRHLRPWWDVHRHRLAPSIAGRLTDHLAERRLVVRAGHILNIDVDAAGLDIAWRPRGGGAAEHLGAGAMVNCAGPASDFSRIGQPLLRGLLADGRLRPDPLRLGLDVAANLAVIDATGAVSDRLFAVGPVTRGRFWEVTAVPEIRRQCATLAGHLAARFAPGDGPDEIG